MASSDETETIQRYEGYSDYQSVSQQIASSVDRAVDGYAIAASAHEEQVGRNQWNWMATEAKANIRSAALKLIPEMEENKEVEEEDFESMLEDWTESGVEGEGYLSALSKENFRDTRTELPDWIQDFVLQIRTAAFQLGYLQAGRTVSDNNLEPAEEEAIEKFTES